MPALNPGEKQLAALAEHKGNRLTHGYWRAYRTGQYPVGRVCLLRKTGRCDVCNAESDEACPRVIEAQEHFVALTMGEPHIRPSDGPFVWAVARDLGLVLLLDLYVQAVGVATRKGRELEIQPIMRHARYIESRLQRGLTTLGLSPAGRKALNLPVAPETNPIAAYVRDAEEGGEGDDSD